LPFPKSANTGNVTEGLDPHVYETSCRAYRDLALDGMHQSILVSGESGAGKTETVKIVMRHLSYVSGDTKSSVVVECVLDGHPLLEAFGNAKTV
jgi:myosin V